MSKTKMMTLSALALLLVAVGWLIVRPRGLAAPERSGVLGAIHAAATRNSPTVTGYLESQLGDDDRRHAAIWLGILQSAARPVPYNDLVRDWAQPSVTRPTGPSGGSGPGDGNGPAP